MKKFEYLTLHIEGCSHNFNDEHYLNEMGKEGWELVGVTAQSYSKPILYLKRELEEVDDIVFTKKITYSPPAVKEKPTREPIPRDIIRDRVYEIIIDHLGCDENEVTEDASLQDDLGADSLDHIEIMMKIEREFNTPIPDGDADNVRTVKDVIDILCIDIWAQASGV
jgi:acyl carrier protein